MTTPKILLVGCGKMGGTLLQHVAAQASICVVDPAEPPPHLKALSGVAWLSAPHEIDATFKPDIIVLAIKPQQMADALPSYARFNESLFLSIAAGQTFANIAMHLGGTTFAIVRAMPNIPASVGQSMTVAVANKLVTASRRAMADRILGAIGTVAWVEDEHLLDAVTALSGSGPAYVFALIEVMAKSGVVLGLPEPLAAKLARQTIIGSGALLAHSSESAEALRIAVTSPGGTTEAALKTLLGVNGLPGLILKTMKSAFNRAKELSST